MIQLIDIAEYLSNNLTDTLVSIMEAAGETRTAGFRFVADGGEYRPWKRHYNNIEEVINGTVELINSEIEPVNGLSISSQTISAQFLVPIINGDFENSVYYYRRAASEFFSTAKAFLQGNETITVTGTQPEAGDRDIRPQIGDSIVYTVTVTFTSVLNGINSQNMLLSFEGNALPIQKMTIARETISDGSAFASSNGVAKTWDTSTALQLAFDVPALINNTFTQEYMLWLLTGTEKVFDVTLSIPLTTDSDGLPVYTTKAYRMKFGSSNAASEGIQNVGISAVLVEAYEPDYTPPTEE